MPDTPNNNDFLKPKGDYKNLVAYKKAECIYDMTCFFVEHYLPKFGDRTVDQMIQAARSGKQNIVEGNEAGTTSMETAIKLINVAKASLKEVQADYEDYLRTHKMVIWDMSNPKFVNARQWCKEHNQPEDFIRICNLRDSETVANVALIMLHQTDYLLRKLIDKFKADFLEKGGIREQMSTARREWRDKHK